MGLLSTFAYVLTDMDPLLLALNQHQKAYQLVQKLQGFQQRPCDDYGNHESNNGKRGFEQDTKSQWTNLEEVMDERNEGFSRKNTEYLANYRELEKRKSDLTREVKPYKSSRFPVIVKPRSPSSERFSVLALEGSRNSSSLSQKLDSLRSSSSSSRNDHDVNAFITSVRNTLPASKARINRLRQEFQREHHKRSKPYYGEWGPQSYQPWQMMDYFLVRPLVEELVNGVFEIVSGPRLKSRIFSSPRQRDRLLHEMPTNPKVLQLIVEEITLEETQKLCRSVCSEVLELQSFIDNRTDLSFFRIFQKASLSGCEVKPSANDTVIEDLTKQFSSLKKIRTKHRSELWSHNQPLYLSPWKRLTDDDSSSAGDDVRILDFDLLVPFDLIESKSTKTIYRSDAEQSWKRKMADYRQREAEYWNLVLFEQLRTSYKISMNSMDTAFREAYHFLANLRIIGKLSMVPNGVALPLTENCPGITSAKASFSGRFMAMGTALGNIIVIDFNLTPPKPIRSRLGSDEGQVVNMAWSLDSLKLIAITDKGVLSVWSLLSDKNPGTSADPTKSQSPQADHDGLSPVPLVPLFKLDAAVQDFKFYTGLLAETSTHNAPMRPVLAAFHPSLTVLDSQPSVCIVVDSNDILKCDLSDQLVSNDEQDYGEESEAKKLSSVVNYPKILPPSGRTNVIGSDIEAELFRQHRNPVVLVGFVGNSGDMVTVDSAGFINIWTYASEFLTKEEIFRPSRKYRLNLTKTQYVPLGQSQVIFVIQENDKTRSTLEIEQERNRVESQISLAMKNLELWHYRYYDDQNSPTQMYIHKPSEGVGSTGALFHVISRFSKTQFLSSYLTQRYAAVRLASTRLLSCKLSSSGKEIVFLLLFPQLSPKEAHITAVVLDLCEMRMKNFRQDIALIDDELYQRCLEEDIASCDITEPVGITGSQYVFVIVDGQLSGYSVATGQKVFLTTDKKTPSFIGCQIKRKKLNISNDSMLTINYCAGKLFLSMFTPKQQKSGNPLFILQLTDGSTEQMKKALHNSVVQWRGNTVEADTQSAEVTSVEDMVREILESIVDDVLEHSRGITPKLTE